MMSNHTLFNKNKHISYKLSITKRHNTSIGILAWKIIATMPVIAGKAQQLAPAIALGIHTLF